MINFTYDILVNYIFKFFYIKNKTGFRINISSNYNF